MNKERNSSIELLRIILIAFVIGFHIISYGNLHPDHPLRISDVNFYPSIILESIFVIAVNSFVLISGYYLINASLEKFAKLYSQVFTYSVVITVIAQTVFYINHRSIDFVGCIKSFFPIITQEWWYFTAYIILFLFAPILNKIILEDEKKLKYSIFIMFVVLCLSPTLRFPVIEGRGFNFVYFMFLYSVGAYIRKRGIPSLKISVISYFLSLIGIIVYTILLDSINRNHGYKSSSFAYDNILVLIASVSFVCLFLRGVNFKNCKINNVSKCVFGVYLFHEHPMIKFEISKIVHCEKFVLSDYFLLNIFLVIFIILTIGVMLEYCRIHTVEKYISYQFTRFFIFIRNRLKIN